MYFIDWLFVIVVLIVAAILFGQEFFNSLASIIQTISGL